MHPVEYNPRARFRLPITWWAFVSATGAWAGEAELSYTGDVLHNARGGLSRGTDFLGKADVLYDVAGSDGLWSEGWLLHVHLQHTHGSAFTAERVGDLQTVSNIEAPVGGRIMELWTERVFGKRGSLRAGLYDLNSEFDAIGTGSLFISSSQGIGPDISQSGRNGPSIFPTTSLALRGEWGDETVIIRGALLDATPGHPDDPGRTAIQLGDGVLGIVEANLLRNATRFGLGAWAYDARIPTFDGEPGEEGHEQGIYALVEHTPGDEEDPGAMRTYLRIGKANPAVLQIGFYAGAGVVLPNGLSQRLDDTFGISIGYARNGRAYRTALGDAGTPTLAHETEIEVAWRVQVTDRLAIQPDIQYVINPGTDPNLDDALIIGVRLSYSCDAEL